MEKFVLITLIKNILKEISSALLNMLFECISNVTTQRNKSYNLKNLQFTVKLDITFFKNNNIMTATIITTINKIGVC